MTILSNFYVGGSASAGFRFVNLSHGSCVDMGSALLALPAHFEDFASNPDRRRTARRELKFGARAGSEPVTVLNISRMGMLLESSTPMLVSTIFQLELPKVGLLVAEIVWNRDEFYGCEFDQPISFAEVSATLQKHKWLR